MIDDDPAPSRSEKEIFFKALDIDDAQARKFFLQGACGHDPALQSKVHELLENHLAQDAFMREPALEPQPRAGVAHPGSESGGLFIGPYKLLQKLGEGGFGEVWMAEQRTPIKRRVALKIIKLGIDTKEVVARFEAERQALSMMDHPNIAKVFDAGAIGENQSQIANSHRPPLFRRRGQCVKLLNFPICF